jgi:3-oxoacyl-[acyl-carrier protein] reductase
MKKLQGKLALVTGSSRGIGRQVALGLAREGCDVIVHGRSIDNTGATQQLLKAEGVKVYAISGELSSTADVQRIIDQVKQIGSIDILYNNAAISIESKSIFEFKPEDFDKLLQVNLYSMHLLCSAFAPAMREKGYGRIVNVTSGIQDQPNLVPYGVSKAAVDKYTKDLSFELKDSGVLVNMIDPGWIRTDLGGPNAWNAVEDVLPGMLVPVLLDNDGETGKWFSAQDYRQA